MNRGILAFHAHFDNRSTEEFVRALCRQEGNRSRQLRIVVGRIPGSEENVGLQDP
jgi:hypothetical protein